MRGQQRRELAMQKVVTGHAIPQCPQLLPALGVVTLTYLLDKLLLWCACLSQNFVAPKRLGSRFSQPCCGATVATVTDGMPPPVAAPELYYTADLLLPNAQILKQQRISRRTLMLLGLRPRDVITLLQRSPTLGFDMYIRSGAVVISLGADGPSVIASAEAAWIFHRRVPTGPSAVPMVSRRLGQHGVLQSGAESYSRKQGKTPSFDDIDKNKDGVISKEEFEAAKDELLQSDPQEDELEADLLSVDRRWVTSVRLKERFLEVQGAVPQQSKSALFPMAITEAALAVFTEKLDQSMQAAASKVRRLLQNVGEDQLLETFEFGQIRELKQKLGRLDSISGSLRHTLLDKISDDDDMRSLATQVCNAEGCSQEDWELCFEYYLQRAEEVELDAHQRVEELENLQSLIQLDRKSVV